MNNSGSGVGSTSIVLIFAVLCLTIFALISYSAARTDQEITSSGALLVKEYYQADTLAERILDELLRADTIPGNVLGVDVTTYYDFDAGAEIAEFFCPITDSKELYVEIAVFEDSYDILKWRMRDVGEWEIDEGITVWPGFDDGEILPVWSGD